MLTSHMVKGEGQDILCYFYCGNALANKYIKL